VANSESLAETSRRADPFPVEVIPNGVDDVLFHPATESEAGLSTRPIRLLFVGRVHAEKNLGTAFRQLAALPETVRRRFEFLIAGDGAQRPELEKMAELLGIAPQLRWLGWKSRSEIPALYRSADALILPSFYEGMSNVVLEAMASGLPVLASDVPGNRGPVISDETGVLFPLDQPDKLGAALSRLATDLGWAGALGRAGRRRVQTAYSWERSAQRYLELLAGLPSVLRRS
jgi:glycosyltransferase involved in cell wall biosynthesis